MTLLLIFLLTHLLTDFVFQTDRLVARKAAGESKAMDQHGLIHFVVGIILLALTRQMNLRYILGLVILSVIHVLLDIGKQRIKTQWTTSETLVFQLDQMLHLIIILLSVTLVQSLDFTPLTDIDRWLGIAITVVFTLWTSGIIIGLLLEDLRLRETDQAPLQGGRPAIGRYIGYLERGLIVFFLLNNSIASLGLLATFKTLARFRQLDDQAFAEYYLLGTLLSLSFGIAGTYLFNLFYV